MGLFEERINTTKNLLEVDNDRDLSVNPIKLGNSPRRRSKQFKDGQFDPTNVSGGKGYDALDSEIHRREKMYRDKRLKDPHSFKQIQDLKKELEEIEPQGMVNKIKYNAMTDELTKRNNQQRAAEIKAELKKMEDENAAVAKQRSINAKKQDGAFKSGRGHYSQTSTSDLKRAAGAYDIDPNATEIKIGNASDQRQQEPAQTNEPIIDPDGKGLFRRGIEAAGRGLKRAGAAAANAVQQQDPYNPNQNRNALGNLGVDKLGGKPNQGKVDAKKIDQRLKSVQAKLTNLTGDQYQQQKQEFDKLRDEWSQVKPTLISYPEKNNDWRNYINNSLRKLETKVGISPDPDKSRQPGIFIPGAIGDSGYRVKNQ